MKQITRFAIPAENRAVLAEPPLKEWEALARSNVEAVTAWDFSVGGMCIAELRSSAREEAFACARDYSSGAGILTAQDSVGDTLLIVNGHQPGISHPGVWIKDFMLQRVSGNSGFTGLDLVVDTDAAGSVSLDAPCLKPRPHRCSAELVQCSPDVCFGAVPVPTTGELQSFAREVRVLSADVGLPHVEHNVDAFLAALAEVSPHADDLGQALTGARRALERQSGSDYLELGVSRLARGAVFRRFAAHLCLDARAFAECFNDQLARYRAISGTRGKGQPFPELGIEGDATELPLWALVEGRRRAVYSRVEPNGSVALVVDGEDRLVISSNVDATIDLLGGEQVTLVPRGITLTLFTRLAIADLFIHGVGGGRYDQITDGVIDAYFGVAAPAYVVASATLHLPFRDPRQGLDSVAQLERRLDALRHNPDRFLTDPALADTGSGQELAAEKGRLVSAIALPGADRKALGIRIREINTLLQNLVAPLVEETVGALDVARAAEQDADVLFDRSYAYCLWNADEVISLI